jgi:hypothetical protein
VRETKRQLLNFLIAATRSGKHVAGYGTPRQANTLLNYCGIQTDFVEYTVDADPSKQDGTCPAAGSRSVPRLDRSHPSRLRADSAVAPAKRNRSTVEFIQEWGGRCVILIPEVHMVT